MHATLSIAEGEREEFNSWRTLVFHEYYETRRPSYSDTQVCHLLFTLGNTRCRLPLITLQQGNTDGTFEINVGMVNFSCKIDLEYQQNNVRMIVRIV